MIISASNIGMSGSRKYASQTRFSRSLTTWNGKGSSSTLTAGSAPNGLLISEQSGQRNFNSNRSQKDTSTDHLLDQFRANQKINPLQRSRERMQNLVKIREETVNYLLDLLLGKNPRLADISSNNFSNFEQLSGGSYTSEFYYSEQETTSFSTEGTVKTSDGREINFQVDLTMSRSFTQYASEAIDFGTPRLCDPLVINLDAPAADVTDQTFFFDLDADGHDEEISKLGAGSGFLALDKNGDGVINDGSELFGVKSGNGFADLSVYDSDGNGWIDEADDIFDKLLIWTKDANGSDQLIGLGKAGVGAIYLGAQDTPFSMNDQKNETNAIVRQTGIFLYENGGVGTVQQIDFAT